MLGVYNLSPPTLVNGQQTRLQVDASGRLLIAGASDESGVSKAPVYAALGYRQVTATSGAFALPTPPAGTRRAIIQADGQALRWRDDGTNPTATVGMLIANGSELRYDGADMGAIKLIAAAAGAIANIAYYS